MNLTRLKQQITGGIENSLDYAAPVLWVLVSIGIIYGIYWVFKTGSYFFFYEDMVQETIREMVKDGSLK